MKKGQLRPLPKIEKFQHTKLSLLKDVLALVHINTDDGFFFNLAAKDIVPLTEKHWRDRNINTISHQAHC